ncbi:MAG: hypothetical protein HYW78_03240 [Parcubacteria group bacterium]|nr:hypothetical protein [Parcubacteria group bacterium]
MDARAVAEYLNTYPSLFFVPAFWLVFFVLRIMKEGKLSASARRLIIGVTLFGFILGWMFISWRWMSGWGPWWREGGPRETGPLSIEYTAVEKIKNWRYSIIGFLGEFFR